MESTAEVSCVLKVNIQCESCQMKLLEVLRSISGVYSVTLDAEEGLAKISGEMDPNILLWALARNGKHAELKWVSFKSAAPQKVYYNYNNGLSYRSHGYNGYGYGTMDQSCRNRSALPERSRYGSHQNYCLQRGQYRAHGLSYGYLPQNGTHY